MIRQMPLSLRRLSLSKLSLSQLSLMLVATVVFFHWSGEQVVGQFSNSHFPQHSRPSIPSPTASPFPSSGFRSLPDPPTHRPTINTRPSSFETRGVAPRIAGNENQQSQSRIRGRSLRGLFKLAIFVVAALLAAAGWAVRKINR